MGRGARAVLIGAGAAALCVTGELAGIGGGAAVAQQGDAARAGTLQRPYVRNQAYDEDAARGGATRSAGGAGDRGGFATTRVAGGAPAPAGQWPSMVALMVRDKNGNAQSFCGGTLIDSNWVLTAAHCLRHKREDGSLFDVDPTRIFVRKGTTDLRRGGRDVAAAGLVVHPGFDRGSLLNDIALVQLATPSEVPRQLLGPEGRTADLLKPERNGTIMGFGLTVPLAPGEDPKRHSDKRSSILLDAQVPIIAKQKCVDGYQARGIAFRLDTPATFCAGYDQGGRDSCPGDSGGPLLVRDEVGQAVQVGVVSYGLGCAQPNAWGIYASVPHFESWIRQHVPNASFAAAPAASPAPATPANPALAALQELVADLAATAPGASGQLTVDVLPGEAVVQGRPITIRVTSALAGSLVLYARDAAGGVTQLFPHGRSKGDRPGQTPRRIAAGGTLRVPTSRYDGFVLSASDKPGLNEVVAVVVDERVDISDLTKAHEAKAHEGFRRLENPAASIAAISRRMRDLAVQGRVTSPVRAVATRSFRVLAKP
jgi:hypothetical protein